MATPSGTVPTDIAVKILVNIIADAYKQVGKIVSSADVSSVQKRNNVLKQLQELVDDSDKRVQDWVKVQIPTFYEMGLFEATKDLHNRGNEVKVLQSFNRFHKEAIQAIAEDAYTNIASGMQGIAKTGNRLVAMGTRQALIEKIATGTITGETRRQISKNIEKQLVGEGIQGLIDRRGREWDLDRYAEMLARTKLTQAHNTGVTNRMLESGYDLVQVSSHFGACELCRPFEGKILSVSGRNKAFPSVDDAMRNGLFHPNCRHKILPIENKYLDESVIFDPSKQAYIPYKQYTVEKLKKDEEYITALLKSSIPTQRASKVYRAEDSKGAGATLGEGKYFAFEKENVTRYGTNIKEYYLDPNAKMLELPTYADLDKFEEEIRKNYSERFAKLIDEKGAEKALAQAVTEYAKKLGYDGIISDDKVFGSVVFDPSKLLKTEGKKLTPIDTLITSNDLRKYEVAFNKGDLRVLETLRQKYPTDSRFKIHAEYGTITEVQTKQAFKDILDKHNQSLETLGIDGISEFNNLLEKGNKTKIMEYLGKLDRNKPLVQEMYTMAEYLK